MGSSQCAPAVFSKRTSTNSTRIDSTAIWTDSTANAARLKQPCAKEKSLFSLQESILLYDLISTYFEGLCLSNPKAKRGYSRDSRPDCKQVVVGLVLDAEGFPRAHEIFAGNRSDSTTVADMLSVLQKRVGKSKDATVVVDRGMANPESPAAIKTAGYHSPAQTKGRIPRWQLPA